MAKFDAKAAAERIRPLLADNPWPDGKDELHQQTCLDEVCKELEVEATALNMSHVAVLLIESGTGLHKADMYPKAHNILDPETGTVGKTMIFLTPDEETAYSKQLMSEASNGSSETDPADAAD
jgi:hypothetical protein